MTSVYRSPTAQAAVRSWCLSRIAEWGVPHTRTGTTTSVRHQRPHRGLGTGAWSTGRPAPARNEHEHRPVPAPRGGTGSQASRDRRRPARPTGAQLGPTTSRPPPGLVRGVAGRVPRTSGTRACRGRGALVGGRDRTRRRLPHARREGAALQRQGITRLRVPAPLLAATIPWLLRPSVPRAAKLLNQMSAPDQHPPADLCAWMDLVSRSCRSSLAPAPLPSDLLERRRSAPTVVATGLTRPLPAPTRPRPRHTGSAGTGTQSDRAGETPCRGRGHRRGCSTGQRVLCGLRRTLMPSDPAHGSHRVGSRGLETK